MKLGGYLVSYWFNSIGMYEDSGNPTQMNFRMFVEGGRGGSATFVINTERFKSVNLRSLVYSLVAKF